jgi:hypothetical protein
VVETVVNGHNVNASVRKREAPHVCYEELRLKA